MYIMYLDGVALPVTPSKLDVKIKNQNKAINLINESEVNILKNAGLTEMSLTATVPHVRYPYAVYPQGFKDASYFLGKLEQLKTSKKPFQFICVRESLSGEDLFDTNIKVSLEDYKIEENAADGQELTIDIKLKQYRDFGTKRINIAPRTQTRAAAATVQTARPTTTAPKPKTYTVKTGDTLWSIARKTLGNGSRHTEIFNLNRNIISNPNVIRVGQVLRLPV